MLAEVQAHPSHRMDSTLPAGTASHFPRRAAVGTSQGSAGSIVVHLDGHDLMVKTIQNMLKLLADPITIQREMRVCPVN